MKIRCNSHFGLINQQKTFTKYPLNGFKIITPLCPAYCQRHPKQLNISLKDVYSIILLT